MSVVTQFNGKLSSQISGYLKANFNGLSDVDIRTFRHLIIEILSKDGTLSEHKNLLMSFLKKFDLGIQDLGIDVSDESNMFSQQITILNAHSKLPEHEKREGIAYWKRLGLKIRTNHPKFNDKSKLIKNNVRFDLDTQESEGTKKLILLSSIICVLLGTGGALVIDELEAKLHPKITLEIIKMFNSKELNLKNAQLIFTTHDTNLLSRDLFRRDQIWFTEKDKYGATSLYSLAEFKVRNDASYAKDYIAGKYGAIPFIGSLNLPEQQAHE